MTQEIDIIISSIYIWENLSLKNLSRILTVIQLANQLAKAKLGSKSVHFKVLLFLTFLTFYFEVILLLNIGRIIKSSHMSLCRIPNS